MNEIGVIFLLCIIALIFLKQNNDDICQHQVMYSDTYFIPRLETADENHTETLTNTYLSQQNKRSKQELMLNKTANKNKKTNGDLMKTRWASKTDLHEKNNIGSAEYTNTDVSVVPSFLQHHLKNQSLEMDIQTGRWMTRSESMTDSEMLDQALQNNKKYIVG